MNCLSCGGTDHARASSAKCLNRVKGKSEAFKEFNKTFFIKINLNNTCKEVNIAILL